MNYTIEIYLYDNKLIFTGTRDLYFEKYKGNGPGVYSQPILCLPSSCSISEIQQALLTCVGVLEQNEKKIIICILTIFSVQMFPFQRVQNLSKSLWAG